MSFALWPWLTLILLGAWHGINPGMGWLFAVALGLQKRSRISVFQALLPIAFGHALAIGSIVFLVYFLGIAIPMKWLQIGGAAILFCVAIWKLWRTRHPTWVGMQVSFWDLTSWSWIMASAHGAGLMIIPVLLGARASFCGSLSPDENLSATLDPVLALSVVAIHTISHLAVSAVIAWLVYDFVGLAVLRRTWVNLDLIWCCSLLGAAVVLLFVPIAYFAISP
ncbi:MAG TPA: hypothetical protein VGY91_13225 [Chthoniobacterales bacterium]|jgi:hypothetical protein|nr:hypothetical protein [Chthoniobacterales bacterium]